ncbi:acyl carrier protein [Streptomyces sp. WELS2]|uniref:acyl carrier protein n=1 Tax=Streptomyces sp. WELS2 TaxID=2749435 RepID=UPI0015EFFDEB|nr:acyl carrier protein [Streptomyces sp. WELS2]
MTGWDEEFEALVRGAASRLPAGIPLDTDTDLSAHGLDSVEVVALIMRIETAYGIVMPDELLQYANFATPGALWAVLEKVRGGGAR